MGWVAILRLIRQGESWSGHERHCAFLNFGSARFANVSATTGLDFQDDGRGLATVDWDHDGDLDLWLYNRTGPRLRFMRNETGAIAPQHTFVALRLYGTTCNRDAIGAREQLHLKNTSQKLIRTVYAGEGFMSQSSKWLHFGLGPDPQIKSVTVRWPGGITERFDDIQPGRRYVLKQNTGQAIEWNRPQSADHQLKLSPSRQPSPSKSGIARVILPGRFPSPIL